MSVVLLLEIPIAAVGARWLIGEQIAPGRRPSRGGRVSATPTW
ncbi:hypothetical protein ABZT17_08420 [Streptomyces sp. NPDC005648]